MRRLPHKYAPFLFSVAQAALTTGFATAIATKHTTPFGLLFVRHWLSSWFIAWTMMVPVVLVAAPVIGRSIAALTDSAEKPGERHNP